MNEPEINTSPEIVDDHPASASAGAIVAGVFALIGAWVAVGSTGLLAHAFRRGLLWASLAVIVGAAWPRGKRVRWHLLALLAGIIAAAAMAAPRLPASNVLAVVVVLGILTIGRSRADRRVMLLAGLAVTVFALYRHANTSVPYLWLATDAVGGALGHLAGAITGMQLWIGSTFGGIDLLVLMCALYIGWLIAARPAWKTAVAIFVAIIAAHLAYLFILTFGAVLLEALPKHPGVALKPRPLWYSQVSMATAGARFGVVLLAFFLALYVAWVVARRPSQSRATVVLVVGLFICLVSAILFACTREIATALPKPFDPNPPKRLWPPRSQWSVTDGIRTLIPWNMPLIGCALYAAIAAVMFRLPARPAQSGKRPAYLGHPLVGAAALLAAVLPVLGTLSPAKLSLEGKKIVVSKKGFLNWLKPQFDDYGRLAIGMYGTLPAHIESFGGECLISPKLSAADLKDADLLILLFPDDRWNSSKIEQVRDSVGRGELVLLLPDDRYYENQSPAKQFDAYAARGKVEILAPDKKWGENKAQLGQIRKLINSGKLVALAPDKGEGEGRLTRVKELVKNDKFVSFAGDDDWDDAKGQLERINEFVEGGKTLLVFGEHTTIVKKGARGGRAAPVASVGEVLEWAHTPSWMRTWFAYSAFNEVLMPTEMRVVFDSATFEVGGWLQSYEALSHPATTGLPDDYNEFGVVIGASMRLEWPARPLLIGRWGWGDPGDPAAGSSMMGNHRYDPGERMGDIILAGEQQVGKGRVIAFGDTSSITNGISTGAYKFTSRLMSYAAGASGGPQDTWRGVLGLLAAVALAAILLWRPSPQILIAPAIVFAVSLAVCTGITYRAGTLLPDGRGKVLREASDYFSDGNGNTPRSRGEVVQDPAKRAAKEARQVISELRANIRIIVKDEPKVSEGILPAFVDWVVSTALMKTKPGIDPAVAARVKVPPHAEPSMKGAMLQIGLLRNRVRDIGRKAGMKDQPLAYFVEQTVSAAVRNDPDDSNELEELPVNNLAYIDNTHLERFSSESWRMDGTMGITLTLMRGGYIVRDLADFTAERLERAGLVLSIAPGREFTRAEREAVWKFVEGGGIFIITVGHDDAEPSRRLLADFGLFVGLEFPYEGEYVLGVNPKGHVHGPECKPKEEAPAHVHGPECNPKEQAARHAHGAAATSSHKPAAKPKPKPPRPFAADGLRLKTRIREPEPQGHFKSPYLPSRRSDGTPYYLFVRFDAAWAVNYIKGWQNLPDARIIANTTRRVPETGRYLNMPVMLVRTVGKGKFVLVGDSGFAMNKNLEIEGGWPFDGMRENPHFWRWLLAGLRGKTPWIPPDPRAGKEAPRGSCCPHDHAEDDK